jgi:hypothetical protein
VGEKGNSNLLVRQIAKLQCCQQARLAGWPDAGGREEAVGIWTDDRSNADALGVLLNRKYVLKRMRRLL